METSGKKKNNKGVIIALIVLVIAAVAFYLIYSSSRRTEDGSKSYMLIVTDSNGESTELEAATDQEYLKGAMDELVEEGKLSYDGLDQTAGFMIQEINGERAVYEEDSSYWAMYTNGEYATLGIKDQPVSDGDKYEFKYETFSE